MEKKTNRTTMVSTIDRLVILGRFFFALAFVGLGVQHFLLGEFITGRAPVWPESIPGRRAWAYLTGIAFIVMSVALISGKGARVAAIVAALLIFLWALVRRIPIVAADSLLAPTWTQGGKALAFFGGALAIAGTLPTLERRWHATVLKLMNLRGEFITLGRFCLGIFLLITGIQHFIYTKFVASLIPEWFPGDAVLWTYFGGVALIAGGVGIFLPRTAPLAALLSGLMVFSWFWIIHIPRTLTSVTDGIAVFEALAVSGIAFVIAGFLYSHGSETSAGTANVPKPDEKQIVRIL